METFGFIERITELLHIPFENPVLVFFLILVIILISPVLLTRLKIPGIIGLILSGIIIGPNGLNLLEKNSAVDLFSTIGLLYLMFIAGLDLDLNEFRKNKFRSITFGALTFFIPLLLGVPACFYILRYDLTASILIGSMFATHTLIAYPIVSKFNITRNEAVAVTVGGTIITDTAVLLVLAIIIGSANGEVSGGFWVQMLISVIIFIFVIFFIIPKIAKWFFSKLESEKTSHFIFVLSIVFFSAFMAEMAGLEPIIGAFGAGLAVNRFIPHNSLLMNRLKFVGNSLFIPFFLISVGMIVDISVLFSGTQSIFVALILTMAALTGKWIAAVFTQLVFKYSRIQRRLIFGLSSSHAAATLAVILIGYKTGIIDESVLNGTIILILITCIVASFATEKAALELTMADDSSDSVLGTKDQEYEKILIPVIAYKNMESYINLAVLLSNRNIRSGITLLSVVGNDAEADQNLELARKWHDKAHKEAQSNEINLDSIITIDVNTISGILRASREVSADSLLLGWPGKARFFDKLFGVKTSSVINNSDRKVLVYRSVKPVNVHTRALVVCPPLTEYESGFPEVIQLFSHFSKESRTKLFYVGTERTLNFLKKFFRASKSNIAPGYVNITDWKNYTNISAYLKEDDLLIIINSRRGSIAYNESMENLPPRLERLFPKHSILLVYPGTLRRTGRFEEYSDMDTKPLEKSIGRIEKWFKAFKRS